MVRRFVLFDFLRNTKRRTTADDPDLSKYFGKDSTPGGIQFQFRTLKHYAKQQKSCADAGGDPQTLGIGSGEGQSTSLSFFQEQHSTSTSSCLANVEVN